MTAMSAQLAQAADAVRVATQSTIMRMARDASVEMTVHDASQLRAARNWLPPSARVYVSFLPDQAWSETVAACESASSVGLDPVPHIPVRRLPDESTLNRVLRACSSAGAREVLLIAGDYAKPVGPFESTADVLRLGVLGTHGIARVSVAAHPEGHPSIDPYELRRSERDKIDLAAKQRLALTFVTQFFFDAQPFLEWRRRLPRDAGSLRVVAGLAGPAKLTTLLRYAALCGVGASSRALSSRGGLISKLLSERGPEAIVRNLAQASLSDTQPIGLHLFAFGGLVRTCAWLAAVAAGNFRFDDNGGFTLRDE